jgi:hypothetical protein
MAVDSVSGFGIPAICRKKVTAAFDGGRLTTDTAALKTAEFASIRLRLIKVAVRVVETATRICIAFASACPDAALFRHVALNLRATSP